MKNIKKLFFSLTLGVLISGFSANSVPYPGCDCASVISCEAAACLATTPFGIACSWSQTDRIDALCLCKQQGMAHCTNWDTDLVNCTSDTKVMSCPSSAELKKKFGKYYDKAVQATKEASTKEKTKQEDSKKTPTSPPPR